MFTTLSELREVEAGDDRVIIVVGDNYCWGRGKTGKEAYKNASRPKQWIAYDCYENTRVTDMGGLYLNESENVAGVTEEEAFKKIGECIRKKK